MHKNYTAIIAQGFQSIWIEVSLLFRLVGVVKLIFVLSHLFNIQERQPFLSGFVKKKKL